MKRNQLEKILLGISVASFSIMSASFLLMPVADMKLLPGLMFWIGLAAGIITQFILEMRRRAFFRRYHVKRKNMQKPRCGLLSFGSNRMATITDFGLLVSSLAAVPAFILTKGYGYICYILLAIIIWLFCMHCILNGRNYFHVNNQNRVQQVLEQKKAKSTKEGVGEK